MAEVVASMRAAVYRGDATITVDELPTPEPAAGEVLIEVSHCGVCGTDLHFVMEGMGRPGSVGGHEYRSRAAWKLRLDDDGDMEWLDVSGDTEIVYDKEPQTGFWRRFLASITSIYAAEGQL